MWEPTPGPVGSEGRACIELASETGAFLGRVLCDHKHDTADARRDCADKLAGARNVRMSN